MATAGIADEPGLETGNKKVTVPWETARQVLVQAAIAADTAAADSLAILLLMAKERARRRSRRASEQVFH